MLTGLEYVVAAYCIWLITFVVYIILTKHRLKTTSNAVTSLQQRISRTTVGTQNANNI
jgi:hypothetical protein